MEALNCNILPEINPLPQTTNGINTPGDIVFLLLVILLVSAAIIGNSLVILAWFTDSKISHNPSNALFVSLAVTDLIVGGFAIPFTYIYQYVYLERWIFGEFLAYVFHFSYYSAEFVSAYHLILIAIDRYRVVTEGVSYIQRRTLRSILRPIPVLWIIGLLEITPALVGREGTHYCLVKGDSSAGKIKYMWDILYTDTFVFFDALLVLIIPIFSMIYLYSKIFLEVKRRWNKRVPRIGVEMNSSCPPSTIEIPSNEGITDTEDESKNADNSNTTKVMYVKKKKYLNTEKEKKIAKSLGALIFAFLICWIPYLTVAILKVLRVNVSNLDTILNYSAMLGWVNSCVNPILYALSNDDFKIAFKKVPRRIWWILRRHLS